MNNVVIYIFYVFKARIIILLNVFPDRDGIRETTSDRSCALRPSHVTHPATMPGRQKRSDRADPLQVGGKAPGTLRRILFKSHQSKSLS